MPTYLYRCPNGHETEVQLPMADDKPESVPCAHPVTVIDGVELKRITAGRAEFEVTDSHEARCPLTAARVFTNPAAVHFHGTGGTYWEDYTSKYDRKRRRNPGDGLPLPASARITRAEGAEY